MPPLLSSIEMSFALAAHHPGAFQVNLPADLPPRFGGRFNEARFGQGEGTPELYPGAVTEPPGDENWLVALLDSSNLVRAETAASVPLGFEAV